MRQKVSKKEISSLIQEKSFTLPKILLGSVKGHDASWNLKFDIYLVKKTREIQEPKDLFLANKMPLSDVMRYYNCYIISEMPQQQFDNAEYFLACFYTSVMQVITLKFYELPEDFDTSYKDILFSFITNLDPKNVQGTINCDWIVTAPARVRAFKKKFPPGTEPSDHADEERLQNN